jgi:hypothetical protein
MPVLLRIALEVLGAGAIIFIIVLLLNYPRVRRHRKKAEAAGTATCKSCGYVGALSLISGGNGIISSSNFRLVCASCGGSEWVLEGVDSNGGRSRSGADPR